MEKLVYPLVYFQVAPESVLGLLVGSNYQIVDKDLKNVKSTLVTHLKKMYKKYDDYPYTPFESFRMKTFEIKIRPVVRSKNRSFPSSQVIKVPVQAIYGPTDEGHFCCHLPLLGEQFYYYDAKLLTSLVQNFATNILNKKAPEEIYRMMTSSQPQLDEIVLKINYYRDYDYNNGWNTSNQYQELKTLAEQYPNSKSERKGIAAFPDVAWEVEDYISQTIDKIVNTRSNVIIVGNHGTGKSAILRAAIRKISHKSSQLDFTFWRLMAQRITARAKYLGEWQQNVEKLLGQLEYANGILWVIDLIQLLQTGGEGPEDSVAAFLTSYLQNGKLQLVGEVTPPQLESMRRMLPGFVENFQVIELPELPEFKVQRILQQFSAYCQQNMQIDIDSKAIEQAYRLLLRYYPYESFPGKGVKFLSQCVSQATNANRKVITKQHIIDNFVQQTGMPDLFLKDDLLLNREELQAHFQTQIIGQKAAINALCNVVKVFKAGLNNPQKPISTMIFAGPTGVGKTASTKALSEYFFGKGQKKSPLVRIDMSEFQHPSQLARFIGSGGEVGKLVQEVRERPFSVLLLDEIEKADPSVFDALLTVLDEGVLVDAYGRITNFRNTIIIMTSNLGASSMGSIGFGGGSESNYESAIGKFFRPEFVNRIDQIVIFNALEQEDIAAITKLELEALQKREGIAKRGIRLSFSEALFNYLSEIGFDIRYGARPLQRAIENEVIAPLAKWLLTHSSEHNITLQLDYQEGNLIIKK
jgi:ATP-dependent Clp protease ATP-binding subunit ClpA